jgi:NAD(P)-dependent dehydrogenase (short-subunit alcohol dehydrogenase family)
MTNNVASPLAGRVALITGANTGIGLTTAVGLARQGAQVFVACRSSDKALAAVEEIQRESGNSRVAALSVDLGDLASVRACADAFLRQDLPLHLLINNAGLAGARGLTKSGFELAFGVNHVGHFLLTSLLLERIKRSAPARIVTVASKAHYRASGIDWDAVRQKTRTTTALHEYGVSKLANVLFSAELARRLDGAGVTTYSLHPGVVASDVWRSVPWPFRSLMKLGMISTEKGAATSLYCATSAEAGAETGLYYDECRAREAGKAGQDRALAAELWQRSEEWVR